MGSKRITGVLAIALCLIVVQLNWAGGKEAKGGAKPTITVWGLDAQDHILPAMAGYKTIENEVTIVTTWIPNTQYENKLRVAISAGSPPDVMSIDSPTIASFVQGNALEPLESLWPKADLDDLTKASRASVTYKGHVWAAPI
jgi:ABC-type glycerol-3-phosphate transport system substrate-binding protein